MRVIEGGQGIEALADEILAPLLQWLESISKTPAQFREVMRSGKSFEKQASLLSITTQAFEEGINSITSLHVYAEILGITKEQLWLGFEVNRHIAPQWLIEQVEDACRDKMA
ncbi:MAG: hypothetical protein AAB845_01180 [Patescibacteria group bacterium]